MRLKHWLLLAALLAAGSCLQIRIEPAEPLCSGEVPQHLYPRCRLLAGLW